MGGYAKMVEMFKHDMTNTNMCGKGRDTTNIRSQLRALRPDPRVVPNIIGRQPLINRAARRRTHIPQHELSISSHSDPEPISGRRLASTHKTPEPFGFFTVLIACCLMVMFLIAIAIKVELLSSVSYSKSHIEERSPIDPELGYCTSLSGDIV